MVLVSLQLLHTHVRAMVVVQSRSTHGTHNTDSSCIFVSNTLHHARLDYRESPNIICKVVQHYYRFTTIQHGAKYIWLHPFLSVFNNFLLLHKYTPLNLPSFSLALSFPSSLLLISSRSSPLPLIPSIYFLVPFSPFYYYNSSCSVPLHPLYLLPIHPLKTQPLFHGTNPTPLPLLLTLSLSLGKFMRPMSNCTTWCPLFMLLKLKTWSTDKNILFVWNAIRFTTG